MAGQVLFPYNQMPSVGGRKPLNGTTRQFKTLPFPNLLQRSAWERGQPGGPHSKEQRTNTVNTSHNAYISFAFSPWFFLGRTDLGKALHSLKDTV